MSLTQDELLSAIRRYARRPASARELMRQLRVPREDRRAFTNGLNTLVEAGHLVVTRGNRYAVPPAVEQVAGRFSANPGGFGFVIPDSEAPGTGRSPDLYVPAGSAGGAMHGDHVVAVLDRVSAKGKEGHVVQILERRHRTIVGRFESMGLASGRVVPFDPRVTGDVEIGDGQALSAESEEMVLAEITRWPTPTRGAAGRVVEVLGHVEEPGVDTKVIIHKYGIPDEHSDDAVAEAGRFAGTIDERDVVGREDFRRLTTVTIDGEHARDFDDAITIERLGNGHWLLGVHIADVAHYVRDGTALDEEAYDRGTSVYLTERAVHMFPSTLATGLCSLNPGVDRLVQSCVMEVDRQGQVVRYSTHDGVIHSDARMTYTQVNAILVQHDPDVTAAFSRLVPTFELMRELFDVLNARRRRRGSIDFDLPEAEMLLSDEGLIEAIVAAERNLAHRIIEEFMLLANETVAAHLVDHGVPALHRVHEPPDPMKVEQFDAFISTLGHGLGAEGRALRPKHFQGLIDRIHVTPEARPIATLMLRTMQKARYDAASLGHFGLAAERYTHFTSPIRRYPDLVVHRMLRESRQSPLSDERRARLEDELPEAALHLSAMERRADNAERELLQWKKVRFMAGKVGHEYHGTVTGVAAFGLFVELEEHYVEGLVHISSMADDYYRFVEDQHVLYGEHTQKTFRLGDGVRVRVVRVDMTRRQVELGLVEILERLRREPPRRAETRSTAAPERAHGHRRTPRPGRRERTARKGRTRSRRG